MRRVTDYRANRILYNFLYANRLKGRVVIPANLCPDVVETLRLAGMECVVVDISPDTWCMDAVQAMLAVPHATALIYVHTYGIEDSAQLFFEALKRINPYLVIIDDRCLCLPRTRIAPEEMGSADLVEYSMNPKKQVEMGGAVAFLADRWLYQADCPTDPPFFANESFELDEAGLQQAIQNAQDHKETLKTIYRTHISRNVQMPEAYQNWRFNILVSDKETVLAAIRRAGLFASGHYEPLAANCPVARQLYQQVINLFIDHYFTANQAWQMCDVLNQCGYGNS